jgi:hypothetical protein
MREGEREGEGEGEERSIASTCWLLTDELKIFGSDIACLLVGTFDIENKFY